MIPKPEKLVALHKECMTSMTGKPCEGCRCLGWSQACDAFEPYCQAQANTIEKNKKDIKRFINKIKPSDNGCWEWTACKMSSKLFPYGQFWNGKG